jgi:hypothetical protein
MSKQRKIIKELLLKFILLLLNLMNDIQQDLQENKVLQSCFPSPTNDVVVQILSGLDMDEVSKTPSMETLRNEQTNDIEF